VDILLLILLAVGFITGLVSGAVRQLISLAAFVAGFIIACLYYQQLGEILGSIVPMPSFCKVVAFTLLWIIVPIVARLVSALLTSMLDGLFALGILNRLLGGILGLAKYALVLGALIWFFSSINMLKEETMQESKLCKPLKAVPEFVYNLLKASPSPSQGGEKGAVNE
jgi:membrane protein required for colicin V production